MALRMASPSKHPESNVYRVRVAVPARLRDVCGRLYGSRWELIENLATKDPKEARDLADAARLRLKDKLKAAEAVHQGEQANLSDRDVHALAGAFYRSQVAAVGDNPGDPEHWAAVKDALNDHVLVEDDYGGHSIVPTTEERAEAAKVLAAHGLPADPYAIRRLSVAIFEANVSSVFVMVVSELGLPAPAWALDHDPTA